jgi:DNA-binding MarR family transcriptional regulator
MSRPITPDEIDQVIHERARLAIVSALAVAPELPFIDLKEQLGMTDGNLSAHSRMLEDAGYVRIDKSFRGRRPHTRLSLTPGGRAAFQKYLETLQRIVKKGRASSGKAGRSATRA